MIYFSIASGVCCLVIGSQIHLHWGSHWITAICFYTFCITYMLGAGTVPCVFVAEVFLPEVRYCKYFLAERQRVSYVILYYICYTNRQKNKLRSLWYSLRSGSAFLQCPSLLILLIYLIILIFFLLIFQQYTTLFAGPCCQRYYSA